VKGIGRFGSDGEAPVRIVIDPDADRRREIVEPMSGERREVDVYRGLPRGASRSGPCIVEEPDTNLYVPAGATITRDEHANYVIDLPPRA
jgi:N-methylhydantoinase A